MLGQSGIDWLGSLGAHRFPFGSLGATDWPQGLQPNIVQCTPGCRRQALWLHRSSHLQFAQIVLSQLIGWAS